MLRMNCRPSVYCIEIVNEQNVIIGRYIGSSMDGTLARKYSHLLDLVKPKKYTNPKMLSAYQERGEAAFNFVTVREYDADTEGDVLLKSEREVYQEYVAKFGREHLWNVTEGGYRGRPNRRVTLYDSIKQCEVRANSILELAREYDGDESALRSVLKGKLNYHKGLVRSEKDAQRYWLFFGGYENYASLPDDKRGRALSGMLRRKCNKKTTL